MPSGPSPLRYPGGKQKCLPYIERLLDTYCMSDIDYVEPFAGGSSIALSLLMSERAERIWINDLDEGLFQFWFHVINYADDFIDEIESRDVTLTEWERCASIVRDEIDPEPFDLGFATFFLNRTNFSGIISGSPIGGFDQNGAYPIDARYNKQSLARKIKNISKYASRIRLTKSDACILVSQLCPDHDTFLYADPPYVEQGGRLYFDPLDADDHRKIGDAIQQLDCRWLVTYDDVPLIRDIYQNCNVSELDIFYSARRARRAKELAVTPT